MELGRQRKRFSRLPFRFSPGGRRVVVYFREFGLILLHRMEGQEKGGGPSPHRGREFFKREGSPQ